MQGDFTKIELFTMYYETLSTLIELISPAYKLRFSEKIATRLKLLEVSHASTLELFVFRTAKKISWLLVLLSSAVRFWTGIFETTCQIQLPQTRR